MKTALAGINPGAANTANGAAGNASAKADAANREGKPQFDRLMEEKAAHAKTAPSARERSEKTLTDDEAAAPKDAAEPKRAARKPKTAEDWPPPGLVSLTPAFAATASPLELAANAQALLLAGAGLAEAPGLATSATPAAGGNASILAADAISAGILTDPAQTATAALAADALAPDALAPDTSTADALTGTDAQATQPARAEAGNAAKPALQNLLSFAGHLAAGNAVAAVPEAIALMKDAVDALRSEGDADSASPLTNPMAASATTSPNGLARTATVNPLEAPMPDLHNEQFDEAVGTRLTWMAEQKIGHAHIKITPGDLGTVEVRLRLDGDRVHADFSSAQPEVRQALENSLPKLRDMLGQHGFQLAQADVGHHRDSRSSANAPDVAEHNGSEDGGVAIEALLPRPVRVTAHGLLDAYA